MGYITKFDGEVAILGKVKDEHVLFMNEIHNGVDVILPGGKHPNTRCNWVISDNTIIHDGCEKFYDYITWMEYIVNILGEWGYVCNGEIIWHGEDPTDIGMLEVNENNIQVSYGGDL